MNKLLCMVLVAFVVYLVFIKDSCPVSKNEGFECTDIPPDNQYSCALQASWGKCNEPWITDHNFCQKSCGRCDQQPSPPAPVQSRPPVRSRPEMEEVRGSYRS